MSDATAVPTPVPVCVCPERCKHGGGLTPTKPKPHDVTVLSAVEQRGIDAGVRHTPPTNYILKLFSSSSRVENNTNLRLRLGGVA